MGVEPIMAAAAANRLGWSAGLGLKDHFSDQRPPKTYDEDRSCAQKGCTTTLSRYNRLHALPQVLGHLEHQPVALVLGLQRIEDRRQVALELNVHDRSHDLGDLADDVLGH